MYKKYDLNHGGYRIFLLLYGIMCFYNYLLI